MLVHGADTEEEKQGCGSTRCPPCGEHDYLDLRTVHHDGQGGESYANTVGDTAYSDIR